MHIAFLRFSRSRPRFSFSLPHVARRHIGIDASDRLSSRPHDILVMFDRHGRSSHASSLARVRFHALHVRAVHWFSDATFYRGIHRQRTNFESDV
ncbi:hypothetical protein A8H35_26155 [Burkholderia thailandensis]|uniref:Uncharacterized protein n=1 Tax=Burkholderia thailandensis (strain ATCC 700388 / DSM 13276 / CCUG 48851 / CIP 106301 / E264) TaxID=271848 RepID=Q2T8C2_BURTA|nr:hypothetical protein BTH_II0377 [Burkholderia thailandensis E264]AWY61621.1 hypothetical protein A8H35_26155 [Burkholderia thailandensis]AWY65703.1 hypothetical protein A8H36_11315 [Burkholderia thailandensis]KVG06425.1 hypothetical protein WJ25_17025 [Burkholderia thailandensis]PHH34801.1 hypothetical protein CRX59_30300 [Burkholderia thailandensis]